MIGVKGKMYEFNLQDKVNVKGVFQVVRKNLEACCTAYGGSLGDNVDKDGNTYLAIFKKIPNLQVVYTVHPHAGRFATVTNEMTDQITIFAKRGHELSERDVKEIQEVYESYETSRFDFNTNLSFLQKNRLSKLTDELTLHHCTMLTKIG